jgi:Uma2 family endonuclease
MNAMLLETDEIIVNESVRRVVVLLMARPITQQIAMQICAMDEFKLLEIEDAQWTGFDEEGSMGSESHGWTETKLIILLGGFVLPRKLGRIYPSDTEFVLDGTPDNIRKMRRPDIALVLNENLKPSDGFIFGAPDLAIEIISPSERRGQIQKKLSEYFSFGVREVWQVYPDKRQIVVQMPDGTATTYRQGETLVSPDVLPDFALDIAMLFE